MTVRLTLPGDLPALQNVLGETGLFPSEMLPEMMAPFLDGDDPADIWLSCEVDGAAAGFCYAVPEKLTDGTWNMLAIAVLPAAQNKGAGHAIATALEQMLRDRGARILIADTSGTDEFAAARAFYEKAGYVREARIRDFWAAGNDKITYWKAL